jgi:hypothetical protein
MRRAQGFSPFGSRIDPAASESSVRDTGVRVKRFMSERIRYSDEPIGEIKLLPGFIPSPEELALRNEPTKATISLSSERVAICKEAANKHHTQYQKVIRQLLDEYGLHAAEAALSEAVKPFA